ncbi:MAG: BtpA/SgcQ family protein [Polyangiaceae bacterium]|nr:BtpA/SgcQ family protein [Polyangiaceae bacterium]
MRTALPRLVGVVHLAPLPGSPRAGASLAAVVDAAAADARALAEAGFDAVLVENYGDAPFYPGTVPAVTVSAMTACALAVRQAAPRLALGLNVLRNDAEAALALALAAGGAFVRINVHSGARVTDQGLVEGRAHETLRARRALGLEHVALFCDVDVKHSAGFRPLLDEARELAERSLADALLVTGKATGSAVAPSELEEVARAVDRPVYVASGATPENLGRYATAHGIIVGSCLRRSGHAGDPVDFDAARRFAEAFRRARPGD